MDDLNENIKRIKKLMKVESEIDESEISGVNRTLKFMLYE